MTPSDTPETNEACRAEHDGRPSQYVIADFARKLEKQRNAANTAAGFCDKHKPDGGARNCLVCACEKLTNALSEISRIVEGVTDPLDSSAYELGGDEQQLVELVRRSHNEARARIAELEADKARLDWLENPAKTYHVRIMTQPHGDFIYGRQPSSGSLREVIDHAMKQKP